MVFFFFCHLGRGQLGFDRDRVYPTLRFQCLFSAFVVYYLCKTNRKFVSPPPYFILVRNFFYKNYNRSWYSNFYRPLVIAVLPSNDGPIAEVLIEIFENRHKTKTEAFVGNFHFPRSELFRVIRRIFFFLLFRYHHILRPSRSVFIYGNKKRKFTRNNVRWVKANLFIS